MYVLFIGFSIGFKQLLLLGKASGPTVLGGE